MGASIRPEQDPVKKVGGTTSQKESLRIKPDNTRAKPSNNQSGDIEDYLSHISMYRENGDYSPFTTPPAKAPPPADKKK